MSAIKKIARPAARKRRSLGVRLAWLGLKAVAAFYAFIALALVLLRWVDPFTTAVQAQRRVESWVHHGAKYEKHYRFLPLKQLGPDLPHAVVAAEDARFYQHHGFDWHEIKEALDDELENGKVRGASTIEQQLAKNLFLTTWRSPIRKGIEACIVPLMDPLLGKSRVLELYLNVVEWGPGVFGGEAAAHYHYKTSAARLGREQAARLAAILPAPRRRKPARVNAYAGKIETRMRQMGW